MQEIGGIPIYWAWFILAALLAVGEIIAPGVFLIFIAFAAACVGIATALAPVPLAAQLMMLGVLSVVAVYMGRRWYNMSDVSNDDPLLNDRSARMVGQSATVVKALSPLGGRVRVGDSEWPAKGPDMKVGETGRIAGVDAGILILEKAE